MELKHTGVDYETSYAWRNTLPTSKFSHQKRVRFSEMEFQTWTSEILTDLAAITGDTGRTYAFKGTVFIIHACAIVGTGIFWTGVYTLKKYVIKG